MVHAPLRLRCVTVPLYSQSVLAEKIALWMRRQVTVGGAHGLVVGLSGGVDSAVVARLCQMATRGDVLGVLLPCQSDPQDETDARLVAQHFSLPVTLVRLDSAYEELIKATDARAGGRFADTPPIVPPGDNRTAAGNLKARLRMAALYFLANSLNYLVAGTGNRSEIEIGYYTKYGDGGVDMLPLGSLLKAQVYQLARELDIPAPIIEKVPTAGLWPDQTDEGEIGFTYRQLETYLDEGPEAISPALALRIDRLMRASEHKRTMPPSPAVAS